MLLENLFAEYLLECQIRKFTPKTIRGYKNCIDLLVRYCKEKHGITDVKDVSHIHIRMFFKELTETNHKESYINTLLKSYRAFFKYAIAEEGSATITAKHGTKSLKCTVTVKEGIEIEAKASAMKKGKTQNLTLSGADDDAEIKWTTSDKKVLTVTSAGKVTAKGAGKAKIYAAYNGVKYSITISVGDIPKESDKVSVDTYNGHTYAIFNERMSWEEAKEFCESLGGYLAAITTKKEQAFIEKFNTNSANLWIGGRRDDKDSSKWNWVTGEKWKYTNWGDGEPNNQGSENSLSVWPQKWNDLRSDSSEQNGFICEWDFK